MNTRQKKAIGIAAGVVAVIAIVALIIFLVIARANPQENPFGLEMGQTLNADSTGVTDNGKSFSRTKPIYAFAHYPDTDITKNQTAIMSVISESTGKVIQQQQIEENDSTEVIRMDLENVDWEPGIYELTFARSGTMIGTINFSLHQ
ncbi:hypothetical protein [Saccharibacillus kuerlensis]|uniref:DUF3244 domain-containing protein n=1 Tax=Saccharibacillus kuerlensis TaxID=459527 RepID=A0ABQ2KTB0_9BACL|nr:hypothetical protein [Saccharibacillus kuerlensis]GGN91002.1 hypothetical protein GCM10010969_02050 [Saccharibacillus kuerlensis]